MDQDRFLDLVRNRLSPDEEEREEDSFLSAVQERLDFEAEIDRQRNIPVSRPTDEPVEVDRSFGDVVNNMLNNVARAIRPTFEDAPQPGETPEEEFVQEANRTQRVADQVRAGEGRLPAEDFIPAGEQLLPTGQRRDLFRTVASEIVRQENLPEEERETAGEERGSRSLLGLTGVTREALEESRERERPQQPDRGESALPVGGVSRDSALAQQDASTQEVNEPPAGFVESITPEPPVLREGEGELSVQEIKRRDQLQQEFEEQSFLMRTGQLLSTGIKESPIIGTAVEAATNALTSESDLERLLEENEIALTDFERGVQFTGTLGALFAEFGATRAAFRGLGALASSRGVDKAAALLRGVGQGKSNTRAGGAAIGVAEGLPTDIGFAVRRAFEEDGETDGVFDVGVGVTIGAIAGAVLPGGDQVRSFREAIERHTARNPEAFGRQVTRRMRDGENAEQAVENVARQMDERAPERVGLPAVKTTDGEVIVNLSRERAEQLARDKGKQVESVGFQTNQRNFIDTEEAGKLRAKNSTPRTSRSVDEIARESDDAARVADDATESVARAADDVATDGARATDDVVDDAARVADDADDVPRPRATDDAAEASDGVASTPRFTDDVADSRPLIERTEGGVRIRDPEVESFIRDFANKANKAQEDVSRARNLLGRLEGFTGQTADTMRAIARGIIDSDDSTATAMFKALSKRAAESGAKTESEQAGFAARSLLEIVGGGALGAAVNVFAEADGEIDVETLTDGIAGFVSGAVAFVTGSKILRDGDTFKLRNQIRHTDEDGIVWVGGIPESVRRADELRRGKIGAEFTRMRENKRVLIEALDEDFGLDKEVFRGNEPIPDELANRVDEALRDPTGASFFRLPEATRNAVDRMRTHIDALSLELERRGEIAGPLAAAFDKRFGTYVHRGYRLFDRPAWMKEIDEKAINRVEGFLRREFPDMSADEMEQLVRGLVYDRTQSMFTTLRDKGIPVNDLSILKSREDIPPEIRALWGEIDDPIAAYADTVTEQAGLIANVKMMRQIRDIGREQGWLFTKDELPLPPTDEFVELRRQSVGVGGNVEDAGDDAVRNDVFAPLSGMFVPREMKDALEMAFQPEVTSRGFQTYMKILGVAKGVKTVGSAMTHVRNFNANFGFLLANGQMIEGVRNGGFGEAFARGRRAGGFEVFEGVPLDDGTVFGRLSRWIRGKAVSEEPEDFLPIFTRLQELGVVKTSARAGELERIMDDAFARGLDDFQVSSLRQSEQRGVLERTGDAATRAYRAEDDIHKVTSFMVDMQRYRRAFPDMPTPQLEEFVAERVRSTYPTFDRVAPFVKDLRVNPVIGMFVSFPAEVYRTTKNNIKFMREELASDNPALREIGQQRLAGLLSAGAIPNLGLGIGSRMLVGISAEEERSFREHLPPWSRNNPLVFLGRNEENDSLTYVDLGYTDPFAYMTGPAWAMLAREGDFERRFVTSLIQGLKPFFAEEIFTQRALDIARNTKRSGGQVYDEDVPAVAAAQMFNHLVVGGLTPGTVDSFNRILKGASDFTDDFGNNFDFLTEFSAATTGFRASKLDMKTSMQFKTRDFAKRLRDARFLQSEESQRAARDRITTEAAIAAKSALFGGLTRRDILLLFREKRIAKDDIRKIMRRLNTAEIEGRRVR